MAKQTVQRFDLGFTNQSRFPYALTILACGHAVSVETKPTLYVCAACNRETTSCQHASCSCGSTKTGFNIVHIANPHLAEDRITQVGDVIECEACDKAVEKVAWLRSLPKGVVHHARFDPRFSPGSYHLYRHDASSPSGFFLIGSVPATKEFDAILNEIRVSPLSPTEGA